MTTPCPVTYFVTPSLMLGEVPTHLKDARRAHGVDDALQLIRSGQIAILPVDEWDSVPLILASLGLTEEETRERISMARTGNGHS